jgi:hypothetical protein
MRKSREHLFSSLISGKGKCKFTASCGLFSNASYTCTHTGGSYCGKYRRLSQPPKYERAQTPLLLQSYNKIIYN